MSRHRSSERSRSQIFAQFSRDLPIRHHRRHRSLMTPFFFFVREASCLGVEEFSSLFLRSDGRLTSPGRHNKKKAVSLWESTKKREHSPQRDCLQFDRATYEKQECWRSRRQRCALRWLGLLLLLPEDLLVGCAKKTSAAYYASAPQRPVSSTTTTILPGITPPARRRRVAKKIQANHPYHHQGRQKKSRTTIQN